MNIYHTASLVWSNTSITYDAYSPDHNRVIESSLAQPQSPRDEGGGGYITFSLNKQTYDTQQM